MTPATVAEAKAQARALRQTLVAEGRAISHAQALEMIARQVGARDWNTLHARLSQPGPLDLRIGQRVEGRYLDQPFAGEVTALTPNGSEREVTIRLDQPVDVVVFESFSNLRRTIRSTVDAQGVSIQHTSNGRPHLILTLPAKGAAK